MNKQHQYQIPELWGGIECTINRVDNTFRDQLAYNRFYEHQNLLQAITELPFKKLRFPVLWENINPIKER